jgi:hypothetical protein
MSLNYSIMAQSAEEFLTFQRGPSSYLWHCMHSGVATTLVHHISIYAAHTKGNDQSNLLYLNMVALGVWTAMSKTGTVIGRVHRPPQSARLILGMPFRGRSWGPLRWAAQQPVVSNEPSRS